MSFLEDLKRPFNLFTTAIGIIGLLAAVWFYFLAKEQREPYFTPTEPVQIVDSRATTSTIKVADKSGLPVTESVYVIEVSIWNAGKKPIEPDDVRIPLQLTLPNATRILDYTVVRENEPLITGFVLTPVAKDPRALTVSFKHLDPGLGARVKIVYAGEAEPDVVLRGAIVGAEIRDGRASAYRVIPRWLGTLLSFSLGWIVSGWLKKCLERVPADWSKRKRVAVKGIMIIGAVGAVLLVLQVVFGYMTPPV